jgi:hypothetical protein
MSSPTLQTLQEPLLLLPWGQPLTWKRTRTQATDPVTGQALPLATITDFATGEAGKTKLLISFGEHARELITSEVALWLGARTHLHTLTHPRRRASPPAPSQLQPTSKCYHQRPFPHII